MDSEVANFIKSGGIHPTRKSHRTAARGYHTFLTTEGKSRSFLLRLVSFLDLLVILTILFQLQFSEITK